MGSGVADIFLRYSNHLSDYLGQRDAPIHSEVAYAESDGPDNSRHQIQLGDCEDRDSLEYVGQPDDWNRAGWLGSCGVSSRGMVLLQKFEKVC